SPAGRPHRGPPAPATPPAGAAGPAPSSRSRSQSARRYPTSRCRASRVAGDARGPLRPPPGGASAARPGPPRAKTGGPGTKTGGRLPIRIPGPPPYGRIDPFTVTPARPAPPHQGAFAMNDHEPQSGPSRRRLLAGAGAAGAGLVAASTGGLPGLADSARAAARAG